MNRILHLQSVARGGALLIAALVSLALLLSACDLVGNDDEEAEQALAQAQAQAAEQPAPVAAAEPVRSSTAPPQPRTLDAPTIYQIIRASIALVETEFGSATGLVTREGRIIVDGAVVDGAETIAVTLSNGERLEDISVELVDYVSGLATVGPISSNLARRLPAVNLGDGEELAIGSNVYAVGFSASGVGAEAGISAGLLSWRADWSGAELTLISTDASIPFDQTGLVLANANGMVIGIAPRALAARGLYVSSGDLARQLAELPIAGEMQEPGAEAMSMQAVVMDLEVQPGEPALLFMTEPDAGPRLSLTVTGDRRASVSVIDATGATIDTATVVGGGADTVIVSELSTVGPYQVWIATEGTQPTSYAIQSEQLTMMMEDVSDYDDRPWNPEDQNSVGLINPDQDVDVFTLQARAGDVFEVRVESLTVDVYLDASGAGLAMTDDDGLGGLSGTDAMLRLEPTEAGELRLAVGSISGTGGYLISVEQLEVGPEVAMTAAAPAMAMEESFPAFPDPPVVAMRGDGDEMSLTTHAVSPGADAGKNMLAVSDADGSFEITATILAAGGATARLLISNSDGELVFQSTVTATCSGTESCSASLIANPLEAEGGEWTVAIEHGGSGAIEQWQVEAATDN